MSSKRHREPVTNSGEDHSPDQIAPAKRSAVALQSQHEIPIPLSSPAVFWQPRHLADSANLIHLPFLFWLTETIRPTSIVQLGLRDGVTFMGLCQSIDKLGLESVCMGLDLPSGDAAELSDKLIETHTTLYGDFSFILREELGRAARHIQRAKIDMLVIDTPLDESLLTSLQAHWQPLLSDRAVLVLHDSGKNLLDDTAQRFHDKLSQTHPAISFPQSHTNLDVFLMGKNQPDRLLNLAQLELGTPGYLATRQVFNRLGQGIVNAHKTREKTTVLERTKVTLKDTQERLEAMQETHEKLKRDLTSALESEEAQVVESAKLKAKVFDLTQELEQARANDVEKKELMQLRTEVQANEMQLSELRNLLQEKTEIENKIRKNADALSEEIVALRAEHVERITSRDATIAELANKAEMQAKSISKLESRLLEDQAALEKLTAHSEKVRHEYEELVRERDSLHNDYAQSRSKLNAEHVERVASRDTALADLATKLEVAERDNQLQASKINAMTQEITVLSRRLRKAEEKRDYLRSRLEAALNSTSWRITAPLRGVKNAVTRSD